MKRQRGAALLMAMLTVALVATFAAAALWQQWRTVEVETAERARIQSGWILTGALDWARLLLREDAIGRGRAEVDHLGEPWAVPLQEARLSSFLAADNNNVSTDFGPEVMEAFLSGQMVDLSSMMNINNMVSPAGKVNDNIVEAFARLFAMLGLPEGELQKLVENLRFAVSANTTGVGAAPLQPKRLSELVWLGVSPQTIAALEPYVTILPPGTETPLNVNTASAEAIAAVRGVDLADAQRMVQIRNSGAYFRDVPDFETHLASQVQHQNDDYPIDVKSNFFEVRARLRLDKLVVEERSMLRRSGSAVIVLSRERGAADPTALSRLATAQR